MSDAKDALDKFLEPAKKELERMMAEKQEQAKKERFRRDFEKLDLKQISKKSKKDLIAWMTGFPPDSPQHILGQQELNRKSTSLKLKVAIGIAIFNAVVAISIALWKFQSQDLPKKPSTVQSEEETTKSQLPEHKNKSMSFPSQFDGESGKKTESSPPKKK